VMSRSVGIPVPPAGDPLALLDNLTLPTDLDITEDVIRAAVLPAVDAKDFTWDHGFALSLAGDLMVAAAPGVLQGRITVGMNLGLPSGPHDPPGLQLVGKGEVSAFGIPFGTAGLLLDFADPVAPTLDFAFASPTPGSPIALIAPAVATIGVEVHTDGVVLGTIAGLRAFVQEVLDGTLATGGQLFDAVLNDIAVRLDADHDRPLAALLLDADGDGHVGAGEDRTITAGFLLDRLLGRNGQPALLPANVSDAALSAAAHVASALLDEVLIGAGDIVNDPDRLSAFGVDALQAIGSIATVVHDATADSLTAFGERFNPSLKLVGNLQPTFFGLALGDPTIGASLTLDPLACSSS